MNYREKIIEDDINLCEKMWNHLTEWEQQLVESIRNAKDLSRQRFNKLQEIAWNCKYKY